MFKRYSQKQLLYFVDVLFTNAQMSTSAHDTLEWAVKEMKSHVAEVKQIVASSMSSPALPKTTDDLNRALLLILNKAEQLHSVAIQCSEVIQKNTAPLLDEENTPPSLEAPKAFWDLCDEWMDSLVIDDSQLIQNNSSPPVDADITSEDWEMQREWENMPSPESPKPLWELCEEWGMNYDSDQSRGIN